MSQMNIEKMLELAKAARLKAYAPYSNFLVGCCVCTDNDEYFVGCNVENTSFRMTDCAETTAIGNMIVSGAQKIKTVLVVSDTTQGVPPCGACLQKISEFADKNTMLYIANLEKVMHTQKFHELFPADFAKEFNDLMGHRA